MFAISYVKVARAWVHQLDTLQSSSRMLQDLLLSVYRVLLPHVRCNMFRFVCVVSHICSCCRYSPIAEQSSLEAGTSLSQSYGELGLIELGISLFPRRQKHATNLVQPGSNHQDNSKILVWRMLLLYYMLYLWARFLIQSEIESLFCFKIGV